jgi:NAD(P)-dependent dehydrogenase (short-subunit alcohol dehydrogenase family)
MTGTIQAPLLVLGGAGIVGAGVVDAAVEAGWPVIAVDRDVDGLERLRVRHADADLTLLPGSFASDADGLAIVDALRRTGRPLAGVVATVAGGGARGRLLDRPSATLCQQLDQDLVPHLVAARQLLPLLAQADRGASYILIGGPGGATPWAGYGHRSVAAAALRMLAAVLHDEARPLGVRLQLLAVDAPVCIENERIKPCPHWPTAVSIGRRALGLVTRETPGVAAQAIVAYSESVQPPAPMNAIADESRSASYVRRLLARTLCRAQDADARASKQEADIDAGRNTPSSPLAPFPAPPSA